MLPRNSEPPTEPIRVDAEHLERDLYLWFCHPGGVIRPCGRCREGSRATLGPYHAAHVSADPDRRPAQDARRFAGRCFHSSTESPSSQHAHSCCRRFRLGDNCRRPAGSSAMVPTFGRCSAVRRISRTRSSRVRCRRKPSRAANEIRSRRQHEDCQGARADDPTLSPCTRRPGDRVETEFVSSPSCAARHGHSYQRESVAEDPGDCGEHDEVEDHAEPPQHIRTHRLHPPRGTVTARWQQGSDH